MLIFLLGAHILDLVIRNKDIVETVDHLAPLVGGLA